MQALTTAAAIISSWKTNGEVIQQKTDAWIANRNPWFAAQQQAHRTATGLSDRNNAAWHQNQARQSRNHADFSEALFGHRTVEDTTTGERRQADLGNVGAIVNRLNEAEPGRLRQIPLRDGVAR